jgi:hypothetical protein
MDPTNDNAAEIIVPIETVISLSNPVVLFTFFKLFKASPNCADAAKGNTKHEIIKREIINFFIICYFIIINILLFCMTTLDVGGTWAKFIGCCFILLPIYAGALCYWLFPKLTMEAAFGYPIGGIVAMFAYAWSSRR